MLSVQRSKTPLVRVNAASLKEEGSEVHMCSVSCVVPVLLIFVHLFCPLSPKSMQQGGQNIGSSVMEVAGLGVLRVMRVY